MRGFSCLDQFLCLAFAQLTYRESLRDIETCLRAMQPKLYHMGIRARVARSTLADANETRDWRIVADFAQVLIAIARPLYATEPFGVELAATVYAFDSTTIDLCLALFPWARFRQTKGPSSSTRCSTCAGTSRRSSTSPTASCTTSRRSMSWSLCRARITCWIAGTSTSPGSSGSSRRGHSS